MDGMNRFPLEIVHYILAYAGKMKYRNGKYMYQISPEDDRYHMLKQMPKIVPYEFDFWYMTIKTSDNHVRIEKYMSVYSSEYPDVSVQTSVSSRFYRFAQHGISYRWIHEQRDKGNLRFPLKPSLKGTVR